MWLQNRKLHDEIDEMTKILSITKINKTLKQLILTQVNYKTQIN